MSTNASADLKKKKLARVRRIAAERPFELWLLYIRSWKKTEPINRNGPVCTEHLTNVPLKGIRFSFVRTHLNITRYATCMFVLIARRFKTNMALHCVFFLMKLKYQLRHEMLSLTKDKCHTLHIYRIPYRGIAVPGVHPLGNKFIITQGTSVTKSLVCSQLPCRLGKATSNLYCLKLHWRIFNDLINETVHLYSPHLASITLNFIREGRCLSVNEKISLIRSHFLLWVNYYWWPASYQYCVIKVYFRVWFLSNATDYANIVNDRYAVTIQQF